MACRGHCRTASRTCSSFSGVTSGCSTVSISSSPRWNTSGMMPIHTPLDSHRPKSTSTFLVTQAASSQYLDRYVQPARNILHGDPLATVPIHLVTGHEVEQLLQCDPAFHPGQRCAKATVNSVPKTEVLRLGLVAVDVEGIGVGEGIGVAVRGGLHQEHRLAGGNRATAGVCLFQGPADVVLNWSLVAQQLFDGARDLAAVFFQLLPLVWVAGEQHGGAADQLCDGLGAGPAQKRGKTAYFNIVELASVTILAGDFGGDQLAEHVVLRVFAPLLHQPEVIHRGVDVGLQ